MVRPTSWIAIVALVAATGCKKSRKPPTDAAITVDAAAPAAAPVDPPTRSKLDAAARIKGDVHAPPAEGETKKPPRDATGIEKRR